MSQPASPSSNKKNLVCRVLMLDDSEELLYVPMKSHGSVLFNMVISKLKLLEADYFDLQYKNVEGIQCWLDHEKLITNQLPQNHLNFEFVVKFYTPDPGMLEEEHTRYLFALQVKRDLLSGRMQCQEQTTALLLSYIVQADYGDLTDEDLEMNPDYLRSVKLFENMSPSLESKIIQNHRAHFGQSPMDADYNLLDTARKVEFYGITLHNAKDHESVPLHLAVIHMGIVVFQNATRINTFSWAKIRKLSFKRKKFLIKLHPEGFIDVGFYKDTVEFYFNSRNECKNFWKKCLEHHAFFRCQSVKKIPRNKTRVVSHGSSFRYSGRTQKQLVDYVRENFVKRPNFQRSTSMRTVNGTGGGPSHTGTIRSLHNKQQQQQPFDMDVTQQHRIMDGNIFVADQRQSVVVNQQDIISPAAASSMDHIQSMDDGKDFSLFSPNIDKNKLKYRKSEPYIKPKKANRSTVDDFHCSYFKSIDCNDEDIDAAGHDDMVGNVDSPSHFQAAFRDNASQDSYHLHDSRCSIGSNNDGDDDVGGNRGAFKSPEIDYQTDSKRDKRSVKRDRSASQGRLRSAHKSNNGQLNVSSSKGKSLAELDGDKCDGGRTVDKETDIKRDRFAKIRPATVAYDNVISNLNECLTNKLIPGGPINQPNQSYSTDIDSVLSPVEDTVSKNDKSDRYPSFVHQAGKTTHQRDKTTKSNKDLNGGDDECITIVDSKEDGIQYILHRRHLNAMNRSFKEPNVTKQFKNDKMQPENLIDSRILPAKSLPSNQASRMKQFDYMTYDRLPHRDSFSARDDTIDNGNINFLPNDNHGVWKKAVRAQDVFENKIVMNENISRNSFKNDSIRGKSKEKLSSDHANKEVTSRNFLSKNKSLYNSSLAGPVTRGRILSESDSEKYIPVDQLERNVLNHSFRSKESKLTLPIVKECLSTENVKLIHMLSKRKSITFCDLIKSEHRFTSLADAKYQKRKLYTASMRARIGTLETESSYASADFGHQKPQNMKKKSTKAQRSISTCPKTGYTTGSSSSLSLNDELDEDANKSFKKHSAIVLESSSKNGVSSSENNQYENNEQSDKNFDKHGHVMEWLEEQQALLEPLETSTTYKPVPRTHYYSEMSSKKGARSEIRNGVHSVSSNVVMKEMKIHADTSRATANNNSSDYTFSAKSSLSSKNPVQAQSSLSTQSFPEPHMEVSSEDGIHHHDPNEDFYDVNRILDFVADSNQYMSPETLQPNNQRVADGKYFGSAEFADELCYYDDKENDDDDAVFSSGKHYHVDPKTHSGKGVRKSIFDPGRYRLSINETEKHQMMIHHPHHFPQSINPDKMFESGISNIKMMNEKETKSIIKKVSRTSYSSATHDEDHVSDILDALDVLEVLNEDVPYSPCYSDFFANKTFFTHDGDVGKHLVLSDGRISKRNEKAHEPAVNIRSAHANKEHMSNNVKHIDLQQINSIPQNLSENRVPNSVQDAYSLEKITSLLAIEKIDIDAHVSKLSCEKNSVVLLKPKYLKTDKFILNDANVRKQALLDSFVVDNKENIMIVKSINAENIVTEEIVNESTHVKLDENVTMKKSNNNIDSAEKTVSCENLNSETKLITVELSLPLPCSMDEQNLEYPETISSQMGPVVVKKMKKPPPKPKPKPKPIDKFELFFIGVKVNLENILAKDPKCENLKYVCCRKTSIKISLHLLDRLNSGEEDDDDGVNKDIKYFEDYEREQFFDGGLLTACDNVKTFESNKKTIIKN